MSPEKRRVSSEIVRILMTELASGAIAGGQRLPNERDLAQHFGVSQPTVRESLRALDAMGLIEVRHGSGVYATGSTERLVELALRTLVQMEGVGILDVLDIRCILGDYSAKRATDAATDEDVVEVEVAAQRLLALDEERGVDEVAALVVAFQVAFSRATHNPLLVALEGFLIELIMQLQIDRKSVTAKSWREYVSGFNEDRLRLAEALRLRDPDVTVLAMRRYLDHQHDVFVADPELASKSLARVGSTSVLRHAFPSQRG